MFKPTLDEAKKIASQYKVIPISCEIFADIKTPVEVLRILKGIDKHCFLLESVEDARVWGRYSFVGYDPKVEITCRDGILKIGAKTIETKEPQKYIKEILDEYKAPVIEGLPTFTGGLVGYFSYDFIKYYEPKLNLDALDEEGFNDVDLMLFDKVIAFDNFRQKIVIIVNIKTDDLENNYKKGTQELKKIADIIKNGKVSDVKPLKLKSRFRELFDEENFCNMVECAKEHIVEGDIFQVVLSNRYDADCEGDLLSTYRYLRTINPSPYMFYFGSDDLEIAGASPETLVKLQNKKLYTFPLAGTRPRGKTDEEDKALEEELLGDKKELAEHNMLVDLGRNDIGRIADFGSVKVEKYMSIERFSHVMHIGSTVVGFIRDDLGPLDAIGSILPAGTLSGAPKIRACEIINKLENNKRGIYGGAIGYIDFSGNLDTAIAIRIAFKKNGKVFVRVGAGIVYDSVPQTEYQETINKSRAIMKAIEMSENTGDEA